MEPGEWQYKDVHSILTEMSERYGSKVYIESPDQGKRITFKQTSIFCNKVANFLKQKGIKPSDKISLIGDNSIETMLVYLGVLNYGAIINPINVEESEENVYRLLGISKPRVVFYNRGLTFNQESFKAELWIAYSDFDVESGDENELFALLKNCDPVFQPAPGSKDEIAEIIFTSGTTAVPKGVVLSRECLFYTTADTVDRFKITERDIMLDYRAYSWASTQELSIFPTLMAGATLVFARRFSRSRFVSWLKEYGVTISAGVPTVINFLLEEEVPLHKKDVPALRFMTSSSAPLMLKNLLRFEEKYGIQLNQGAGSSETGWMGLNDPDLLTQPEKRKIGSIGQVPRYKEVLIVDEEGNQLASGTEGEIMIKGKSLGTGYLGPNGEINKFPEEGFRTGDLGRIDSDGFIFITGRKKDLVIRGGVNIAPTEITSWLMEYPVVQEAATIGVPDETYGEDVASFIVVKEGQQVTQEDIINHCKKKLPDFKLPKTVFFIKEIPKTDRQKVAKASLLKIWEEKQGKGA